METEMWNLKDHTSGAKTKTWNSVLYILIDLGKKKIKSHRVEILPAKQ